MRRTKTKARGLSLRALTTTLALAPLAALLLGGAAAAPPAAFAAGFQAPPAAANESGRLDTASLYDLGGRTSALYAFSSNGSAFTQNLFWKSAKGKFDAAKAKLACGDLNADGYPDALVLYNLGAGKSALYAFLSDGSKYVQTTAWSGALPWGRAKLCVGDANGDGLDDAYVLYGSSATKSSVYLFTTQTGAQLDTLTEVTMARTTAWRAQPYASSRAQIAATDVNADGKDELISLYRASPSAARLDVFVSSGAKLQRSSWWQGALQAARAKLACGDVGSDGKGDAVLLMNAVGRSAALLVGESTGTSFSAPTSWWKSAAGALDWASATLACGDVTSDGRADAVVLSATTSPSGSKLTVAASDGGAFAATTFWAGTLPAARLRLACAASTPTVIPQTTEVLSPATLAGAATADGSTYTFANAAQTADLAPGDVMIGEPTAGLPAGVFRKVTAVAGGGAAVMTEAAYLEDALECAQFSADHAITESDFTDAATTATPGVKLVRSRADGRDSRLLTFRLTDVGISKSWGLGADLGPVSVSGTITLRITVHVSGDVSWGEVKSFVASETTTVSTDLKASVTQELSFTKEKTLATWGAGQLIGFTVWVGPVPLYFQPELSIFVGANGEFGVGVETSVHYEASGTLGLRYQDGNFTTLTGFSRSASYVPPTLSASGSLKGYAGAQLGLKLYAAAGPFMRLDGYAKLAADTRATPWWTLKAGLEASLGAQIGINVGFIHWNKDWRSGDLTLAEWTLAQATTPPPTPTPTSTAPPIGQPGGGGVVAYIFEPGDPGYVAGQTHGLIAATADQTAYEDGIQWATETYWDISVPGTGTALGTGSANTTKIIAQNGAGVTCAAGLARAYNGGGYTDWYLPSRDELDKLYLNRVAIGGFDTTTDPYYWSSSEEESYATDAWFQAFGGQYSGQYWGYKWNAYRVRAVRAF